MNHHAVVSVTKGESSKGVTQPFCTTVFPIQSSFSSKSDSQTSLRGESSSPRPSPLIREESSVFQIKCKCLQFNIKSTIQNLDQTALYLLLIMSNSLRAHFNARLCSVPVYTCHLHLALKLIDSLEIFHFYHIPQHIASPFLPLIQQNLHSLSARI